ncbi:MAG: hypothetical protein E7396_02180 [Ruminococcaceae bacterium]|nr:hypothetical protein [Oscillospiraceae bacterium]
MYKKIYRSLNIMAIITLILSSTLILTINNVISNQKIKEELKAECEVLTSLIMSDSSKDDILSTLPPSQKRRITIITDNGIIIDDTFSDPEVGKDISGQKEILSAINGESGYTKRYSQSKNSIITYYAEKMPDGRIIRIGSVENNMLGVVLTMLIPVILVIILIYILCKLIASEITKSIVKPIEKIDIKSENYDEIYPELVPFLKRISGQSKEIILQAERVSRQKARLNTISENMTEGFILFDAGKNITVLNKGASKIFNTDENFVFMPSITDITDSKEIISLTERAFEGEKCSLPLKINDIYYRAFANPVYQDDKLIGVVMMIVDTNEEARLELIRKEFSANVSHELKTPLTTILGYSQLINSGIAKNEDIKNFTQKIEKESSRLLRLIEDIIKLSKLDEEAFSNETSEEVNVAEIIKEITETLLPKAEEKGVSIEVSTEPLYIKAPSGEINELIYNLMENAIKYNRDDGKVTVTLNTNTLTVEDTGIGISEDDLPRIFERFFRADKSRSKKVNGTGLGLSIVKHICVRNGFEITAESTLNQGTLFKVKF